MCEAPHNCHVYLAGYCVCVCTHAHAHVHGERLPSVARSHVLGQDVGSVWFRMSWLREAWRYAQQSTADVITRDENNKILRTRSLLIPNRAKERCGQTWEPNDKGGNPMTKSTSDKDAQRVYKGRTESGGQLGEGAHTLRPRDQREKSDTAEGLPLAEQPHVELGLRRDDSEERPSAYGTQHALCTTPRVCSTGEGVHNRLRHLPCGDERESHCPVPTRYRTTFLSGQTKLKHRSTQKEGNGTQASGVQRQRLREPLPRDRVYPTVLRPRARLLHCPTLRENRTCARDFRVPGLPGQMSTNQVTWN